MRTVAAWVLLVSVGALSGLATMRVSSAIGVPTWFGLIGCAVVGFTIGRLWPRRWRP